MTIQPSPPPGEWTATHPMPSKKDKQPEPKKKPLCRLSVLGVQSIACVVVLLLALLLRVAGGESYRQLRDRFRQSLMSNDLLGALSTLWMPDPETGEDEDSVPAEGRPTPEGTMAVGLRVSHPAVLPVEEGILTSGYGYRTDPTGGGEQFHRGVDIAAAEGTPIAAMYNGVVEEAGESQSLGKYVRLSHGGGLQVLYAHCSALPAAKGVRVRAGETVACVGSTGDATGSHVHIQVTAGDTVYNPAGVVPLQAYV